MTFTQAQDAYIARMNDGAFCKSVGTFQEIFLRTAHKDDLDGAFTAAVCEVLIAETI